MRKHWQLHRHDLVEAAFATQAAEATLGGDFFSGVEIDECRVGILIGDGEGHATRGALNMLALWSAFEASRDSCSAVYVMERIARMADDVGVRGTALYGIMTFIDGKFSLAATSAGHDPFIILDRRAGGYSPKDLPNPEGVAQRLPFGAPRRPHEIGPRLFIADRHTLDPGDLVIAYTDGVSEWIHRNEISAFATEAIYDGKSVQELADEILAEALRRRALEPDPLMDDATVIVLRVKEVKQKRAET